MKLPDLPSRKALGDLPAKPGISAPARKIDITDKPPSSLGAEQPNDTPDPLADLEATGDIAQDSINELNALQSAIKADAMKSAAQRERENQRSENDTEYWFCVCFMTREQKDEFLQQAGWTLLGDKYLSGEWVAKKMGITLSPHSARIVPQYRIDKKLAEFAMPLPPETK